MDCNVELGVRKMNIDDIEKHKQELELLKMKRESILKEIKKNFEQQTVLTNKYGTDSLNISKVIDNLKIEMSNLKNELNKLLSQRDDLKRKQLQLKDSEIDNEETKEINKRLEEIQDKIERLNFLNRLFGKHDVTMEDIEMKIKHLEDKCQKLSDEICEKKESLLDDIIDELENNKKRLSKLPLINSKEYELGQIHPKFKELAELLDINKSIAPKPFDSNDLESFIPQFLKYAQSKSVELDLDFLLALKIFIGKRETRIVPEFITNFISLYLEDSDFTSILNPWAKNGSFLYPLYQKFDGITVSGIPNNIEHEKILKLLYNDKNIDFDVKKFGQLKHTEDEFDVIVGFPPWLQTEKDVKIDGLKIKDYIENIDLINVCKLLKHDGTAFILLPSYFILRKQQWGALSNLEQLGLYVDAILEIPNINTFVDLGSDENEHVGVSDALLVVITKNRPSNLFVAELSDKYDVQKAILRNLKNREEGKIPQIGAFTDIKEFYSLKSLIAKYETIKLAKNYGLAPLPFCEIVEEIKIGNNADEKNSNRICYLPFGRYQYASSSFDNLESSDVIHAHLIINTNKIIPEYLEYFFNSDIGLKLRESWEDSYLNFLFYASSQINCNDTKTPIKELKDVLKSKVMNSDIYLPDLNVQTEILGVNNLISELDDQINDYRRKLWNHPLKYGEIKKSVELFNVGNRFEYWLESLPYPLSSILFACSADSNPEHRVRYLIHFFEALSEFNATIILSSLVSDPMICKNEFKYCLTSQKYPKWHLKPNFGNWNFLGSCMAKKARTLLSGTERDRLIKLFGNPSIKFVETITNKKLYQILREALNYRNQWIGHGPPVNLEENIRRLRILKNLLSKTQQLISHSFEETLFIQPVPGSMSYDGGVFNTNVKQVIGRLPFKDQRVETTHPLKDNTLYILHSGQYEALELLPFFRIMPGPKTEQNACYFYNRYDAKKVGGEVELVSYHFDQDPTVSVPYNEFKNLISLFDK